MITASSRVGVSARALLLLLFGLFALSNVLVPVFLGKLAVASCDLVATLGVLIALAFDERVPPDRVSVRTIGLCCVVALIFLLMGGEGRFLYANEDWQVREAVLADLAGNRWPFAYLIGGSEHMLRMPLGMYLLPALFGHSAGLALLAANTLACGLMLALASTLFPGGRSRRIALIVFLSFSGLDVIGNLLPGAARSFDHLERWAPDLQYSSVITLLFWVPNHALAGWFCALLYLLHRRGTVSVGALAASIPLAAIWSPLAVMGAVPFVLYAGLIAIRRRTLRWTDMAIGVLASAAAMPALGYMLADAKQVPSGLHGVDPAVLALFLILEVAPFLWIVRRLGTTERFGLDSLLIAAAMLLLIPFFYIGQNGDFAMRASIVPLAVLASIVIASLIDAKWEALRGSITIVTLLLSLGAVTGAAEIARALRVKPAPAPGCSLPEVWPRQTDIIADISTYLALRAAMPEMLRPNSPTLIPTREHAVCWSHPWKAAR